MRAMALLCLSLAFAPASASENKLEEAPRELRWIMSTFVEQIEPEAEIAAPPTPPPPKPAPKPAAPLPPPPKAAPAPARKTPTPLPMPAPFLTTDDDIEEIDAGAEVPPYVHCEYLEDGHWQNTRTDDPRQPLSGFTMIAPETDEEIDDFCRTYEMADPETQRMIRLSFELGITQHRRQ